MTYFVHSTSTYNERGRLAGWRDVPLSKLGKKQSMELKRLTKSKRFDAVFSSDLRRAYETAKTAFGDRNSIVKDRRLREINFGMFAGKSSKILDDPEKAIVWISNPFPGGESYAESGRRVKSFMRYLLRKHQGKRIAIVAHQAPQLSFEVFTNHKTWEHAIKTDWRIKDPVRRNGSLSGWRPGWNYTIRKL